MTEDYYNKEAEQAVLCSLILDIKSLGKISDQINYKDFYFQAHQEIYKAITYLFSKGSKVDLITLTNRLDYTNKLQLVSASYLSEVAGFVHTASFIKEHADIVKDKSLRREAIRVVKELQAELEDESKKVTSTVTSTVEKISNLVRKNKKSSGDIKEVLMDTLAEWERAKDHGLGLLTGIEGFDKTIYGYRPGHYWVIVAGTNVGKTGFSAMLVEKFFKLHPEECLVFFSAEMTAKDIAAKIIAKNVNEDFYDLIGMTDDPKVIQSVEWLQGKQLYVFDTIRTPAEMTLQLNLLRMQGKNPKVVFVDYIQNLSGKGESYERISNLTLGLQDLAIQQDICVVALSQVPGDDQKGDAGFSINGKGSKDIDNTAGYGVRIYRDLEHEMENPEQNPHTVQIQIRKNRHGRKGQFEMYYDEPKGLFLSKDELNQVKPKMSVEQVAEMFEAQIK